jgi:hypothetical protein
VCDRGSNLTNPVINAIFRLWIVLLYLSPSCDIIIPVRMCLLLAVVNLQVVVVIIFFRSSL